MLKTGLILHSVKGMSVDDFLGAEFMEGGSDASDQVGSFQITQANISDIFSLVKKAQNLTVKMGSWMAWTMNPLLPWTTSKVWAPPDISL